MAERDESEEKKTPVHIHEDLLEAIISHVPLIQLLPAYNVSTNWRRTVLSSLSNPSRAKQWLIAHIQSSRNPSLVVTRAYDPESQMWIIVPRAIAPLMHSPVRSSHSNLVYMLTPSKLCLSLDALVTKWHSIIGPKLWRSDPIVAVIGSDLIVAGGTCYFEDDPLSVEIYNKDSRRWEVCESMPDMFKGSAASTWLSVAVSDKKMYLLQKYSSAFCSFDPILKTCECMPELRPDAFIFFSAIGFANNRLLLVALLGDVDNAKRLRIWEVHGEIFGCKEIGEMPSRMLERLIDESCSSLSSIDISVARDTIYIYKSSDPNEIIYCELCDGSCKWGRVKKSIVDEHNVVMHRFVFTSSHVGIHDLQKAFGLGGHPAIS